MSRRGGRSRRAPRAAVACALVAALAPRAVAACAVCYGAPDDGMTIGMNRGILTLLGIIGTVQVGFVALFWNVRRRAKELRDRRDRLQLIQGGR